MAGTMGSQKSITIDGIGELGLLTRTDFDDADCQCPNPDCPGDRIGMTMPCGCKPSLEYYKPKAMMLFICHRHRCGWAVRVASEA